MHRVSHKSRMKVLHALSDRLQLDVQINGILEEIIQASFSCAECEQAGDKKTKNDIHADIGIMRRELHALRNKRKSSPRIARDCGVPKTFISELTRGEAPPPKKVDIPTSPTAARSVANRLLSQKF